MTTLATTNKNAEITFFNKINCNYTPFKNDKNLSHLEFYSKYSLRNITYGIGDFAISSNSEYRTVNVVKFISFFEQKGIIQRAIVRKYLFGKTLLEKYGDNRINGNNEVIEDQSKDYSIDLKDVERKCFIVFAEIEDGPNYLKENNLNPEIFFVCRFAYENGNICPILGTKQFQSTLKDLTNYKSPITKLSSTRKESSLLDTENTPILMSDTIVLNKMTPNNFKNVKTLTDLNISSPLQRNLVKRNLNESFGDSPTSILNYSIADDTDTLENPLKLKLRVSSKNPTPKVLLTKLSHEDIEKFGKNGENKSTPKSEQSTRLRNRNTFTDSVRRSGRVTERISYADYCSPLKDSPAKRTRSKTISSESEVPSESLDEQTKTPKRRDRKKSVEIVTPNKTDVVSPRKRTKSMSNNDQNMNKMKELVIDLKNIDINSTPSSVKGKRRKSQYFYYESVSESDSEQQEPMINGKRAIKTPSRYSPQVNTPKSNNNADESFRRSVLRSRIKSTTNNTKSPAKPKSKTKFYYYESCSSDESNDIKEDLAVGKRPIKTPKKYEDEVMETSTPKNKNTKDDDFVPKTPKSNKKVVPKTPKSDRKNNVINTPKSGKNRAKLIRDGVITPSMHVREHVVGGDSTPLMKARSQLHVSYVPTALPCRENEYCDVYNFLNGKLLDGCGGCMYISGVPGTGKTATVTSVIDKLLSTKKVPKFDFVSINGMKLTEPRQSYVEILKQLTGKTVPWEQAQSMLEEKFTKTKKKSPPVVMLIDELDILCTKRQDVVYNLLDWPTKAKTQLIVITIANTMDLPERLLMSRVTSRLGLTRLTFQAYTHKQLQEIVTKRLTGTNSFNPDAIQFVARKVASVSGDARRALDICRRAAEVAESEGKSDMVTMMHVNEALNAMITQPKVRAIQHCSRLEQLILQSIVAEVERTGVEETTFADVFKLLLSVSALDGFKMVTSTVALAAVSRLSACRLVLADQKCYDINQRLILNVSPDDVFYALKKD